MNFKNVSLAISLSFMFVVSGNAIGQTHKTTTAAKSKHSVPADKFDLSHWNITTPLNGDRNKKADTISVKDIQKYAHPDFFYLDENGHMIFATQNGSNFWYAGCAGTGD